MAAQLDVRVDEAQIEEVLICLQTLMAAMDQGPFATMPLRKGICNHVSVKMNVGTILTCSVSDRLDDSPMNRNYKTESKASIPSCRARGRKTAQC